MLRVFFAALSLTTLAQIIPGEHLRLVETVEIQENFVNTVSTADDRVLSYGLLKSAASTTINSQLFDLEIGLGLEYIDGSGAFNGDITLIDQSSNDQLTFAVSGITRVKPDGSTTITGRLRAFSGSGEFASLTGSGRIRGSRSGNVGSATIFTLDIDVRQGTKPTPRVTAFTPPGRPAPLTCTAELSGIPSEEFITGTPDGRLYGLARLSGLSTFDGVAVAVEDLAKVSYDQGSGPFWAWITLTADDSENSQIVMSYPGGTTRESDGSASIDGPLLVITTTGRWVGKTGRGALTASRSNVFGAPIVANIELWLQDNSRG